ncbi:MAG: hypothetical protein HYW24_05315 [Candidatus Aenigmarchaeota archaeon]|nr:hypothetical protein [Candidatus Aenigmarchaeota archaeon]
MEKSHELEIDDEMVDEIVDEILEEGTISNTTKKSTAKIARPEIETNEDGSSDMAARLDELENRIDDLHEVIMKLNNEIKRLKESTSVQKYVKANLE